MLKLFSHSFHTIIDKYHDQSAILPMSVNLAVLRIAIVVRIPVSENRKSPQFLRFLGQVKTRLKAPNTEQKVKEQNVSTPPWPDRVKLKLVSHFM